MNPISNNKGILTLDFLFALVLVLGLTAALFTITFMLSVVETVQYMAFASSRAYFAGEIDPTIQAARANSKFNELESSQGIRNLLKKEWFEVSINDFATQSNFFDEYETESEVFQDNFIGARVRFSAPITNFQIPFFGSSDPEEEGFSTWITSFLGRQPTTTECLQFQKDRWDQIKRFTDGPINQGDEDYHVIADNGC